MAQVTGLTAARMQAIEAASVVDGDIDAFGHLILTKHDATTIDAGTIYPSMPVLLAGLRDFFHPVGSLYFTVVNTNPGTHIGGTWVAWGSGRVPVGVDAAQTEFDTVEETGGAKTHTLIANEMPIHTHIQNSHNHTQNSHGHTENIHDHDQVVVAGVSSGQPYRRYDYNGEGNAGAVFNQGVDSPVKTGGATPTINPTTATNQATTATNQNAGGGAAHNNLQPYITCYMWKRTA